MSIARINPVTGNREPVNMHNGTFDNPVHDLPSDEILVDGEWTPEVITSVKYNDVEVPPNEVRSRSNYWPVTTSVVHPLAQAIMDEQISLDSETRDKQRRQNWREPEADRVMSGYLQAQRERPKKSQGGVR